MKVGLGITTCRRVEHFDVCSASVLKHLGGLVDEFAVHVDGLRTFEEDCDYRALLRRFPGQTHVLAGWHLRGGERARNSLLSDLRARGCDRLFILEDDIEVKSPEAITGYLKAMEIWPHLNFHGHGNLNEVPQEVGDVITCWPNYVGAYSTYTAEALNTVGLLDRDYVNAWGHVHHTLKMAQAGFTDPRPYYCADATGSERWLREQDYHGSAVSEDEKDVAGGLERWRERDPETYRMLWPC